MTTHLVPAREVKVGDTLRYLTPDPLVITDITPVHAQGQYWLVFKHSTGKHRASIFAHVHKETNHG